MGRESKKVREGKVRERKGQRREGERGEKVRSICEREQKSKKIG